MTERKEVKNWEELTPQEKRNVKIVLFTLGILWWPLIWGVVDPEITIAKAVYNVFVTVGVIVGIGAFIVWVVNATHST